MLDLKKPVRTKSKRPVRIYDTAAGGPFPVHGAVRNLDSTWYVSAWTALGKFSSGGDSAYDLENIPEHITVNAFVNVYRDGIGNLTFGLVHASPEECYKTGKLGPIARAVPITIDVTVGHGLDQGD